MASFLGLSLWTGLAFSRFSRPTARVMFSTKAVITPDDGVPTLMFRVANGRGNRISDASVTVTLLVNEINSEGVEWRRQVDLKLVRARSAVFALSWTVLHRIDATSPLRGINDIANAKIAPQLVVSLLGIDDTFGQPIHAMQYYEAADILFGKRFVDIASFSPDGHRVLDFTHFNDVEDDPRASARADQAGAK
jgi:inward rectifier potassium channel